MDAVRKLETLTQAAQYDICQSCGTLAQRVRGRMDRWIYPAALPDGRKVNLLKVLLKHKCEEHQVAQRLVANVSDLEQIAADDTADVAALMGWRREIFGDDALRLKHGKVALAATGTRVRLVAVNGAGDVDPLPVEEPANKGGKRRRSGRRRKRRNTPATATPAPEGIDGEPS